MFIYTNGSIAFPSSIIPTKEGGSIAESVPNTVAEVEDATGKKIVGVRGEDIEIDWGGEVNANIDVTLLVETIGGGIELVTEAGDTVAVPLSFLVGTYTYIKDEKGAVYALTNGYLGKIADSDGEIVSKLNRALANYTSLREIEILPAGANAYPELGESSIESAKVNNEELPKSNLTAELKEFSVERAGASKEVEALDARGDEVKVKVGVGVGALALAGAVALAVTKIRKRG